VLRCFVCTLSILEYNQLNGTIPSSLGSLTGLTYLCVRHAADRRCTVLRRLVCALSSLSYNQLSGTIPSSLGSLPRLQYLCVRLAEGRHCTVLMRLVCALSGLYYNQLSGTIPSSLGSLTGLTYLCVRYATDRHCTVLRHHACALSVLNNNQLTGTIPSSLGSLTGLQILCVHAAPRCTQSLSLSSTVARLWLSVRQCCSAAGGCRTPRLRCTWCQGWWQQRRWISLLSYGVVLCTKPETPKEFLAAMQFVKHSPVDALPDGTENNDAFFKIIKQLCFAPIPRKPAARDCRQRFRRPDSGARLRHATRGVSRHEAHHEARALSLGERAR